MENNSNHWYLLSGLIFGIAIGVVISLLFMPVINREALPAELCQPAKNEYRLMIASAYMDDYNVERAISRLALLEDSNPADALIAQAQEVVASGGSESEAHALAQLAAALGVDQPVPTSNP